MISKIELLIMLSRIDYDVCISSGVKVIAEIGDVIALLVLLTLRRLVLRSK